MTNTKNTPRYGLFYKSRGEWTGPYRNQRLTLSRAQAAKPQAMKVLKSKVLIRVVA